MAFYRTQANKATPAALDTLVHLKCSATIRAKLSEFILSSDDSPVEQTTNYQITRTTSAGTTPVTTLTIESVEPLSPTSAVTAEGDGYATEPTIGDIMMDFNVHQKATYRWVAYPGREIHSVAAANNGLAMAIIAQTAAYAISSCFEWSE